MCNYRHHIVIWWSRDKSMPKDEPETSCIIKVSELYEFWQDTFKNIYYQAIQILSISLDLS